MFAATNVPEQKRITITSKRQLTIPKKFFTELGFENDALCTMANGVLIIEPAPKASGGEFAEQILADLISDGYSGTELLREFKARQAKVRPSVEIMLKAARSAAQGKGNYETFNDVFGLED